MEDSFSARPWDEVRRELDAEGTSYTVSVSRASRPFFPVDETQSYVLRVRQNGAVHQVTLTELPLCSPTVAAYEEHFR